MFKRIINRILYPNTYSSDVYIKYLRKSGIKIGNNCHFFSPMHTSIDVARPYLLSIGDNFVSAAGGCTILTHDYSHTVIRKKYGVNIGDAMPTKIGNNVFVGKESIILMGTTIGNNVIIGAKAVVRGVIPDDVVVAGNPAKVVCTLEEYYKKREAKQLERAVLNVKMCRTSLNRNPTIREMGDAYAWLYLPRTEETFNKYPTFFNLSGDNLKDLKEQFLNSKPMFNSYEEFLDYAINK